MQIPKDKEISMTNYFDNASTTYRKPRAVYKALRLYKRLGANMSRGVGSKGVSEIVSQTRENIKLLVKATNEYDVFFCQSATYAINQIIKGIDFKGIKNVYISKFEHNSVTRVLEELKITYQFKINHLEYEGYELSQQKIEKQFQKENPDMIIISHVSNVCGQVQDYAMVFSLPQAKRAIKILDMAQSCGLLECNINQTKVDAAIFAGHKTLYGFTGIGGAIVSKRLKIKDVIQGGTGIDSASTKMPTEMPMRLEPGTQNLLGIFSLYYCTQFLLKMGYEKIQKIENRNMERLKQILSRSRFLKPIKVENAVSIISCRTVDYEPNNFERFFVENNVNVRIGLQCSPAAHKFLGTFPAGTVRFSIGLFTTRREFKCLKRCIRKIDKALKKT